MYAFLPNSALFLNTISGPSSTPSENPFFISAIVVLISSLGILCFSAHCSISLSVAVPSDILTIILFFKESKYPSFSIILFIRSKYFSISSSVALPSHILFIRFSSISIFSKNNEVYFYQYSKLNHHKKRTIIQNMDNQDNYDQDNHDQETNGQNIETTEIKTIQTHNGKFHADEVGAVALLSSYFNNKDIKIHILRSRNIDSFETSDILVDVGGIYNPETHRYDHHQEDCNETFIDTSLTPLSSVGMIWKHFGKEILEMFINSLDLSANEEDIDALHTEIYFKVIREIDAHDNGIMSVEGGKRNFWENLHLSQVISSMNSIDTSDDNEQIINFLKGMELFNQIFEIKTIEIIRKYYTFSNSCEMLNQVISKFTDENYLIVDQDIPFIYKCLNKLDWKRKYKFIIFSYNLEEIKIRTRSRKDNFYKPIIPLYFEKENTDIIFIHKALFIAKTKTLESAIELVNSSTKHAELREKSPSSYFCSSSESWLKWAPHVIVGSFLVGIVYKFVDME